MKIWCQSCGAFGKDPVWDPYEKALIAHAKKVARPDTAIELHGQEATIPGIDRYHASGAMCMLGSARNAIKAEREGYDAFVMISTIDAGYYQIKELVDIPTVFMLENCLHFAMMLAPKFAFFTHNQLLLARLEEMAKQYGLAANMVPGDYLNLSYSAWPEMFGHPERFTDSIRQKAKGIIDRGAGVLIPAALPLGVWLIEKGLADIDGGRVFDAWGGAIKMAELMVDMKKIGITRSKSSSPSKDIVNSLYKFYGV